VSLGSEATGAAISAADTPSPAAFRAVQILEVLSRAQRQLTVTEIASAVPLAKSSVSNLLTTLEATGMVRRSQSGWLIGYKALEIGQSVLAATDLVAEFKRITTSLPHLSRDTTLLAVLDGVEVLYLARHDGQQPVRLASDIGRRLPAVVTSLGKAMLASLPDDELDERLAQVVDMPRPTRRSHRTKDDLRRDLAQVRARGFAVDDEQNTIGITCFGVALTGVRQPTAVSTTLLSQRITPSLGDHLVRELTSLADQLAVFARG
jgi:IclR family transcriptional regulator, blcABC operon repressor